MIKLDFINKIVSINEFILINGHIYIYIKNKVLKDEIETDLIQLPSVTRKGIIYFDNGVSCTLHYQHDDLIKFHKPQINNLVYYSDSFNTLSDVHYAIGTEISYNLEINKIEHKKRGIYDIRDAKILLEIKSLSTFSYLYNDYKILILYNINHIDGISLQNANSLWQFDIQSISNNPHDDNYERDVEWKIKKFIGVTENKLWIALNHHTIIALDVETGKLLHQIHDIPNFQCEWLPSAVPLPEATVVDEKKNKLIGFIWEFYWEINPTDGSTKLWDLTNELLSQKLRNDLSHFALTDEHIYFASHNDSKVGALNRNTKTIDWQYTFEKSENGLEPQIMNIQGNDNLLGALSSKGNLYLFGKE